MVKPYFRITVLLLMLFALVGCASNPAVPVTYNHVHVSGCNDGNHRLDLITLTGTVVALQFHENPVPPFCSTFNLSTWWNITYYGDSVDGMPHFVQATPVAPNSQ